MRRGADHVLAPRRVAEQLDQPLMGVGVDDRGPLRGGVLLALPLTQPGQPRRGQRAHDRGRPPLLRGDRLDAAGGPVSRDRGDRFALVQHPDGRVPDRLGLDGINFFPQDVPFFVVGLVGVGVDPGVPEPALAPADPPALARLAVLGFADPGAFDRAFPPRTQCLHAAVVGAFGRGQVQVPAGIGRQPRAVPHAGLLKGVPVGQVAGQPVDIADDDHVDLACFDRRDQLPEPVPADFLECGVPVILEGGHHGPAAPPGVVGAAVDLGRH